MTSKGDTTTPAPGAAWLGGARCRFAVWAPDHRIEVVLEGTPKRIVPLEPKDRGYHVAVIEGVTPGARYKIRLDGEHERPDPASRYQPEGVHGPSEVVDVTFPWTDAAWKGIPLEEHVLYEIHVGTFTPQGTFDAAAARLDELKDLGITALELMPVAQFPGTRNWGYDGAAPYAVQNSYGGPAGLRRLVDACHAHGIAVVLDVVYNHLGPEGNYLWGAAPYFTERYQTPWGPAVNFDGPWSDEVRRYFIENALYWIRDFHIDALRLDAVHAIIDVSAYPFLQELGEEVHRAARELGRKVHVMPESDRNDPRLVLPVAQGGCGLDAVWNDDFHHVLHVLLTGEKRGYYQDFGTVEQFGGAFAEGFVLAGGHSEYRRRRHGVSSRALKARQFVIFAQNHDQVGNRMLGERLSMLVPFEKLKLAAGAVLLSPNLPLLFMGEEYGETAPFLYFVSHGDPALVEAVRRGRVEEFARFRWPGEPPDPQAESTFARSKLDRSLRQKPRNRALHGFTRELLALRRSVPALAKLDKEDLATFAYERERVLLVHRTEAASSALCAFNFSESEAAISLPARGCVWKKVLDSAEPLWEGPGSPAPGKLVLDTSCVLRLAPSSCVLFASESDAKAPHPHAAAGHRADA